MPRVHAKTERTCRWCGEALMETTAWERRFPLRVCLDCRMGDRVARQAAAAERTRRETERRKPLSWPRLRAVREGVFRSQVAFSRASGVSRPLISQIEAGKKEPSRATVRKLATALGVEAGDLIDRLSA